MSRVPLLVPGQHCPKPDGGPGPRQRLVHTVATAASVVTFVLLAAVGLMACGPPPTPPTIAEPTSGSVNAATGFAVVLDVEDNATAGSIQIDEVDGEVLTSARLASEAGLRTSRPTNR